MTSFAKWGNPRTVSRTIAELKESYPLTNKQWEERLKKYPSFHKIVDNLFLGDEFSVGHNVGWL